MTAITLIDTERQLLQPLDKAVVCFLTERSFGPRAAWQSCLVCSQWFSVQNIAFKCSCSLVNPDAPAVQCELRTRYPTFMCPACGPQHQQADPLVVTTDAEAMPKVDLEHKQSGDYYVYQLSPDHVEAVYTLCSSDGKANLNGLKKMFAVVCPDCGQRSPDLSSPHDVQQYIEQHITLSSHHPCPMLQQCFSAGQYKNTEAYGSMDMNSSTEQLCVMRLISTVLVVAALHVVQECTGSYGSSSGQHRYMPWLERASYALTEDEQLVAAANGMRPSLAELLRSATYSLLDLVVVPPYIAAVESAGITTKTVTTAHKLAVLLQYRVRHLQEDGQRNMGSFATRTGIERLLLDMLTDDAVFKHFPKEQRVQEFLAMAGLSSCLEVAAAAATSMVSTTHLMVCPCCHTQPPIGSIGCSYCITCLPCKDCQGWQAANQAARAAIVAVADRGSTAPLVNAALPHLPATTAAATGLCPWCQGHGHSAWIHGCLTPEQFDDLNLSSATPAQRLFFTQGVKLDSPWRFEQLLSNGFIKIVTLTGSSEQQSTSSSSSTAGPAAYYIASDGQQMRSHDEMLAWLQQQEAAAAGPGLHNTGGTAAFDGDTAAVVMQADVPQVSAPQEDAATGPVLEEAMQDTDGDPEVIVIDDTDSEQREDSALQQHGDTGNMNSSRADVDHLLANDVLVTCFTVQPQAMVIKPPTTVAVDDAVEQNPGAAAADRQQQQRRSAPGAEQQPVQPLSIGASDSRVKKQVDTAAPALDAIPQSNTVGSSHKRPSSQPPTAATTAGKPALEAADCKTDGLLPTSLADTQRRKRFRPAAAQDPGTTQADALIAADAVDVSVADKNGVVAQPAVATPLSAATLAAPAAAGTAASGSGMIDNTLKELCQEVHKVLHGSLLLSHGPLRSSTAMRELWTIRQDLKQVARTDPVMACTRLRALHLLLTEMKDADVVSIPGIKQLLDEAWLQQAPQKSLLSAQRSSNTVLHLLLLCWSKECVRNEGMTAAQVTATTATARGDGGLCHLTLQVFIKACRLAAAAPPAVAVVVGGEGQRGSSTSELCLHLVQGLSRVVLGCSAYCNDSAELQFSAECARQDWQYTMEMCRDAMNSVTDIAVMVSKVLQDWDD